MPERLDLMISSSIAPGACESPRRISGFPDADDEIFELINAGCLPRRNYGRRIELVHDRRAGEHVPDIESFALIHRTIEHHPRKTGAADFAARIAERAAFVAKSRESHWWQPAPPTDPERYNLNRLIRRDMAEQPTVRFIECLAQSRDVIAFQRRAARDGQFVSLPCVTQIE